MWLDQVLWGALAASWEQTPTGSQSTVYVYLQLQKGWLGTSATVVWSDDEI
jgi:hypothetical protein